jgi:hypothetical protein
VAAAGPNALAVTIYEHPDGVVHAEESGFEGVACVDDAARLLVVLSQVWSRTKLEWVERWARGVLDFVLWMQEPDGTWLNFIHDWDGDKNRDGITSRTGQNFWLARGILATQWAAFVFGNDDARGAYRDGLAVAAAEEAPPDIRALHLFAAVFGDDVEPFLAEKWADELLACRDGDVLKNAELEVGVPHLWGHVQEGALAEAARTLNRPDYLDAAIASAEAVIVPAVTSAFGGRESTSRFGPSTDSRRQPATNAGRDSPPTDAPGSTAATPPARPCTTGSAAVSRTASMARVSATTPEPSPTSSRRRFCSTTPSRPRGRCPTPSPRDPAGPGCDRAHHRVRRDDAIDRRVRVRIARRPRARVAPRSQDRRRRDQLRGCAARDLERGALA